MAGAGSRHQKAQPWRAGTGTTFSKTIESHRLDRGQAGGGAVGMYPELVAYGAATAPRRLACAPAARSKRDQTATQRPFAAENIL